MCIIVPDCYCINNPNIIKSSINVFVRWYLLILLAKIECANNTPLRFTLRSVFKHIIRCKAEVSSD